LRSELRKNKKRKTSQE
jgi:hypothetical protein